MIRLLITIDRVNNLTKLIITHFDFFFLFVKVGSNFLIDKKIVIVFSYVNVNVISRTALIRNRVSRRVFHVSRSRVGILYLFQEAQAH